MPPGFPINFRGRDPGFKESDAVVAPGEKDLAMSPSCLNLWLTIDGRCSASAAPRPTSHRRTCRMTRLTLVCTLTGDGAPSR
ncbi:hypothetical protein GCM10023258_23330 [Terrabacter aeriphilus]|uniref:Uncharacterized protein n=1 Tax=Terrabacter aeriphilus TaxID=515662 RepID=A0ABP9JDL0_9MICO